MDGNQKFFVIDNNNVTRVANILTTLSLYGKEFYIYSVPSSNEDEVNLYAAKLNGQTLINITDPKEKEMTNKILTTLINYTKKNERKR